MSASKTKQRLVFGICVVSIMLIFSSPYAWDIQQEYKNTTDSTAVKIIKILDGEVEVTPDLMEEARHMTVKQVEYDQVNDETRLIWSGGAVPLDWRENACFRRPDGVQVADIKIKDTVWEFEHGTRADAGETVGGNMTVGGDKSQLANVAVKVRNDYYSTVSGGHQIIDGSEVKWAVVADHIPMTNLTDSLFSVPEIVWTSLPAFQLDYGDTFVYNIDDLPDDQYLLFSFKTAAGKPLEVLEIWQKSTHVLKIPVLSTLGLAIMLLLLLVAGVFVLRRRMAHGV